MSTIAIIDLGTAPNDGTGDPLRIGGQEINDNFANLNADKLEIGGYGGTAQDLANDIADRMLISTYDPNGVEADVFNAFNIVTFTTYEVLQGSNVQTNLNSADSVFLDNAQTGVKYGYVIPDGALGVATTFDHENIVGEILDLSDPINPVYVRVNVPASTGINPIEGTIYYYVDKSSPTALSNTTVKPTNAQRRDRMYVFRVITNGGVILGIASERSKTQQTDNTLRELYEFLGNGRVSGLEPLPSGANLTFQVTSGQALGYDTSPNDYDNPNVRQIPSFDTNASSEFFEATSSGVDFTAKTTVNVDQYQDGTGTLVNAGVGNFTVWYVCQFFDSLNMILVPEDDDFNTSDDGLAILSRQRLITLAPIITQDAFCIGAIIAERGTTDLNDSSVLFIETNKLGDFGTGSFATSAPVGSYFEVANALSEGDPIAIKTTLGLENAALTDTTNTFTAVQTFDQIIQSSGIAVAGATVNDVLLGDGTYTALSNLNTSPLTTKGDLYAYSTMGARLPVGADGQVLTADSAEPTGLKYTTVTGTGTVTSVAISGNDGIEVDSGSPITAAGTIELGINAPSLKTTLDYKQEEINGTRQVIASATGATNLDLNAYVKFNITMTGACTFTFTNVPTGNNVKVVEIMLDGAFAYSFTNTITEDPDSDTYDGLKYNRHTLTVESDIIRLFIKNLEDV